jgi:uncharacterized protein (DUF2336 family)
MSRATTAALIAELDGVVTSGSPERCMQILRLVTDLFLSDAHRLDEAQISVFDEIIVRLIERVEIRTLTRLSVILSETDMAPRQAIRRLAFHGDASVAAPVLAKSDRLSEEDLFEIANTCSQQHLLALAGRKNLNEALTDTLIRRADTKVANELARNGVARFSECGYATLVGRAERDESLVEKLGLRLDIPGSLLRELLAMATDAVKARFLTAPRPAMGNKNRASIEVSAVPVRPIDYAKAQNEVVGLNRAGKLNDSQVNRFAVRSEYTHVLAALSFMSEVKIEAIQPLIDSDRLYGLIVACKASRLSWPTTTMIIRNRPACLPATEHELEQGMEVYQGLALSVAQWTIRFGSNQIAARAK